jgi:hypothetical protein
MNMNRILRSAYVLLALAAVMAPPARAQYTVSTDRPGLGFNPATVPARALQVELGVPTLDYPGTDDDPATSLAAAARFGLTDRTELRVSTSYAMRTPGAAGLDGPTGIAGLRAGLKVVAVRDTRLSLALIPEVVLPVGSDALVADDPSWSLNAAAGIPLGAASLTLVAGAQVDPVGPDDHETTGLLAAVLGRALAPATSAYVEAGLLPGPDADAAYVGAGVAWLPSPLVQLDAWLDVGVTDAASDALFGMGISFLVP